MEMDGQTQPLTHTLTGDADAFPDDPTQWRDSDGDGFGDNTSGNNPDECPENTEPLPLTG